MHHGIYNDTWFVNLDSYLSLNEDSNGKPVFDIIICFQITGLYRIYLAGAAAYDYLCIFKAENRSIKSNGYFRGHVACTAVCA